MELVEGLHLNSLHLMDFAIKLSEACMCVHRTGMLPLVSRHVYSFWMVILHDYAISSTAILFALFLNYIVNLLSTIRHKTSCLYKFHMYFSVSPKALLQRPVAGSQVPYCPPEKSMTDCWSPIEPSTFKVRGGNYLR